MQKYYIVYITDIYIYLYLSQRNTIKFEAEYKCDDAQSISDLCKLLDDHNLATHVYLDTTEVYFELKSFKHITQQEANTAINNYAHRNNHLMSGIAKVSDFQQQIPGKDAVKKKKSKATAKDQHSYVVFLILSEFASKSIKTFINFISHGNSRIANVRFLPMTLIKSSFITSTNDITINIRINNGGRVATVASHGDNFIINREENIDLSNQDNLKEDIESTMLYIETALASQISFNINIMTEVELNQETTQFYSSAVKVRIMNISDLQNLHKVKIIEGSPYPLNDNVLALAMKDKSSDHAMSNIALNKKKRTLGTIKLLHNTARLTAVCIVLFQLQIILRNAVTYWQKIARARTELTEERKRLEEQAKDRIDASVLARAKAIAANKKMANYKFDLSRFIAPIGAILSQEQYVKVEYYSWKCTDRCNSARPNIEFQIQAVFKSPAMQNVPLKGMIDKLNTALIKAYGTNYNVNIPNPGPEINQNGSANYSTTILITTKDK
jgi:hypothetical protein